MTTRFVKTSASGLLLWISGQRPYASWMRPCVRSLNNFHVDVMTASTFFTYLSLVVPFHGVNNPEKVN